LRQRADFLAAASGVKAPATGFVVQARERADEGPARVGFTVTKKIGTAVVAGGHEASQAGKSGPVVGRLRVYSGNVGRFSLGFRSLAPPLMPLVVVAAAAIVVYSVAGRPSPSKR
jgi:hypothetical protein